MSASDEEISNVIGGTDRRDGQGGSDGDDDDDDDDDDNAARRSHRRTGCGFGKDIAKAKQVVLHQFTRASKKLHRSRKKRDLIRSSSSRNARSCSGKNKMIRDDGTRTGCKFCFSRPQVLESPYGSPTSDPNDPNFSYVMLKNLIEKNDFRYKECNPHLD